MAAIFGDFSARAKDACEAGSKFVELFYETMDKRRQVRLFRSTCTVILQCVLCFSMMLTLHCLAVARVLFRLVFLGVEREYPLWSRGHQWVLPDSTVH